MIAYGINEDFSGYDAIMVTGEHDRDYDGDHDGGQDRGQVGGQAGGQEILFGHAEVQCRNTIKDRREKPGQGLSRRFFRVILGQAIKSSKSVVKVLPDRGFSGIIRAYRGEERPCRGRQIVFDAW